MEPSSRESAGYLLGSVLAIAVSLLAKFVGLDRDRAFYPTVLIVIATYYVLFAAIGGTTQALLLESAMMTLFLVAAVAGFKFNLWMVVAALAGHGVFDFFHCHLITNAGVPTWWPSFCLAYDACAGGYLAWLLSRSKERAPSVQLK